MGNKADLMIKHLQEAMRAKNGPLWAKITTTGLEDAKGSNFKAEISAVDEIGVVVETLHGTRYYPWHSIRIIDVPNT